METPPDQLEAIRGEVRERLLALRSLERILMSDDFAYAYEKACDRDKKQAGEYITVSNLEGLRRWLSKQTAERDYAELSLRDLRLLAQRLGVPFYSRLTKASLLSEISKYEQRKTNCILNS